MAQPNRPQNSPTGAIGAYENFKAQFCKLREGGFRTAQVTLHSLDVKRLFMRQYFPMASFLYHLEQRAPRDRARNADALSSDHEAVDECISTTNTNASKLLGEITDMLQKHKVEVAQYAEPFVDSIDVISANNKTLLTIFTTGDTIASGIDGLWLDGHIDRESHRKLMQRLRALLRLPRRTLESIYKKHRNRITEERAQAAASGSPSDEDVRIAA